MKVNLFHYLCANIRNLQYMRQFAVEYPAWNDTAFRCGSLQDKRVNWKFEVITSFYRWFGENAQRI